MASFTRSSYPYDYSKEKPPPDLSSKGHELLFSWRIHISRSTLGLPPSQKAEGSRQTLVPSPAETPLPTTPSPPALPNGRTFSLVPVFKVNLEITFPTNPTSSTISDPAAG